MKIKVFNFYFFYGETQGFGREFKPIFFIDYRIFSRYVYVGFRIHLKTAYFTIKKNDWVKRVKRLKS